MKRFLACAMLVLVWTIPVRAADLMVFSGAGLMKPMEEMRKNFEGRHGAAVDVHYGSSGEIFGMVAAGQPCDVLIPGAAKYTMDALKNGWVEKETIRKLVLHLPAIAVPEGNPAKIESLEDLARKGVRVSIGDPRAPAIGRVSKKLLTQAQLWENVQPNIKVYAPTVNQLLIYVALNQVDAAIIWKDLTSWAEAKGKIEVVDIEPGKNLIKTIPTAVCTRARNRDLALQFNSYVASDEGLSIWKKWGFTPCAE
jgi:molybdate transport system substrate-binding protein